MAVLEKHFGTRQQLRQSGPHAVLDATIGHFCNTSPDKNELVQVS
jgi:hypothetical protein